MVAAPDALIVRGIDVVTFRMDANPEVMMPSRSPNKSNRDDTPEKQDTPDKQDTTDKQDTPDKQDTTKKSGRGRPRDPTAAGAVREATVELLSQEGYHGLTMSGVARRAGVAKTTIYRRWPSKAEMVLDAIAEHAGDEPLQGGDSGDPVTDLRALIVDFHRTVSGRSDQEVPIVLAELLREADIAEAFRARFVDPMIERARSLVARAVEQGRLRQDTDAATLINALAAPAVYQPVALDGPDDHAERIFDLVMHGAGRPAAR